MTTNAIPGGKPDAGKPHGRFDEGEVTSAKPRRGVLLYRAAGVFFSGVSLAVVTLAGTAASELPRLKWLDSDVGEDGTVTRPLTPIVVDVTARKLKILGRELRLGINGLPEKYIGFFSPTPYESTSKATEYLAAPVAFGGLAGVPTGTAFRFTEKTPCRVAWTSVGMRGGVRLSVEGSLEYDGYAKFVVKAENVSSAKTAFDPVLVLPVRQQCAVYMMGLGHRGGLRRGDFSWKWNKDLNQDALWIGAVNLGAMIRLGGRERKRPLINCYYRWKPLELPDCWKRGVVTVVEKDGAVLFTATGGHTELAPGASAEWGFELFLTPFKPIDFPAHFTDRYYHPSQHTEKIVPASVRKTGANIVNLHHNTLWNPYINYPYNDDGGPYLKRFTAECGQEGVRVKVYYTTREVSQNMPEFDALLKLGGEVILKRNKSIPGWPLTNKSGPDPRLVARAGDEVLPAWRENISFPSAYSPKPDLAVVVNPDSSRWNNFYLAGLDLLVKEYGIAGIYVDDSALDRTAMRRARRILDADGRRDRRIDMHSWSHFNESCGWIPSDVAYLELYPYIDRLWHGEAFDDDLPPDVWLIERSGLAWGLGGEMLGRGNPFRGLVFGQTDRLGWGGKPEGTWKFMDDVGFTGMKPSGWWEPDCPLRIEGAHDVKATLWIGTDKRVLVLANWSDQPQTVSFTVSDEEHLVWTVPAIADVQPAGMPWITGEKRTFPGNGGAVLMTTRR